MSRMGQRLPSTLEFFIKLTNVNEMLQIFSILMNSYFKNGGIFFPNLALPQIGQIA